jgi:hypothetical protein
MGEQGPFPTEPSFPPPEVSSKYHSGSLGKWKEVNGEWWAFYSGTGPGEMWDQMFPGDPNWWRIPETKPASSTFFEKWACRHGEVLDKDENICDGTCGKPGDYNPVTPEQIEQAKQELAQVLKEYS